MRHRLILRGTANASTIANYRNDLFGGTAVFGLALRDHKDQSARRGRREMRVAKAQSDPPASADHQGCKGPPGPPGAAGPAGPKGDPGPAPAIRVVTGTDSVSCGDDEILAGFVCARGASDGAKCATPGTAATGLCVRR
jgi:hypothetical protein